MLISIRLCRSGPTKVTLPKLKAADFEVIVPGKWILAGEHAVLRGSEALVFPLFSKFLRLIYTAGTNELEINIAGQNHQELELIIWSVLERAFRLLNIKRSQISGVLEIQSSIALGGGMGASATLCVALTEWLQHLGFIQKTELFNFARDLENLFHGESSGVDVAVTLNRKPLAFTRNSGFTELKINSQVKLYLSYSGERGVTKECIEKVKALIHEQPQLAEKTDLQMIDSVSRLKVLLAQKSDQNDLSVLTDWSKAITQSNQCFEQWGLITENVRKHQSVLMEAGALAVKLTGSGGGGYVLSLWQNPPPATLPFEMIACFE